MLRTWASRLQFLFVVQMRGNPWIVSVGIENPLGDQGKSDAADQGVAHQLHARRPALSKRRVVRPRKRRLALLCYNEWHPHHRWKRGAHLASVERTGRRCTRARGATRSASTRCSVSQGWVWPCCSRSFRTRATSCAANPPANEPQSVLVSTPQLASVRH